MLVKCENNQYVKQEKIYQNVVLEQMFKRKSGSLSPSIPSFKYSCGIDARMIMLVI